MGLRSELVDATGSAEEGGASSCCLQVLKSYLGLQDTGEVSAVPALLSSAPAFTA